ncbi:DUF72 domain-containing protein [Flavihumibacter sp. R14]|nr:DUF72 domain-containing protein [Flavihumibacter soli]
MTAWKIGCSGFHYKHWKEFFYPKDLPQKRWFEFYCRHFNTVELNVTFYRFPKLSFVEDWYNRSPKDFVFAVKAPRLITHFKQFHDAERVISDFYSVIKEGLKDKLGCVLFQLPPRSAYTEERLERIVSSLNPSFENVLEFRHLSWWNEEVFKNLEKHKITFCGMSHPDLPQDVIQNNSVLYYRFHGVPELYKSLYDEPLLIDFVNQIKKANTVKTAFIYFNNDIGASAIINGKQMQHLSNSGVLS